MRKKLIGAVAIYVGINIVMTFCIPPMIEAQAQHQLVSNAANVSPTPALAMVSPSAKTMVLAQATEPEGVVSIKMLLSVIGTLSLMMLGVIGFFLQRTLHSVEASVTNLDEKLSANFRELRDEKKREHSEIMSHMDAELNKLGNRITVVDEVNREARHDMTNKINPVAMRQEVHATKLDDYDRRITKTETKVADHDIALATLKRS